MKPSPQPEERTLVLTRTLDAPRRLVFQVWSQPEHLVRGRGPTDFTPPTCEVDFRVGGAYRFCMRAPGGSDHWVWGEYREIVAPERRSFTWHRADEEGSRKDSTNLVTVTLAETAGRTHLTLHHTRFQTVADRNDHEGGWTQSLDRLATLLATH